MKEVFITREALEIILKVSRELYPREFVGQLRGKGNLIREVLIIPKSTFGHGFSQTRIDMIPLDTTIIGSVHSHPGTIYKPSITDLIHFSKFGYLHLIVRYPYESIGDIACYNNAGEKLDIKVLMGEGEENETLF